MGSLNAAGISVVSKARGTLRNIGGAITTNTDSSIQGAMGIKTNTQQETEGHNRTAAELGTQPDVEVQQYSTMCVAPTKKVASSNDAALDTAPVSRDIGKIAPDSGTQPEIANKAVSQHSTYNTGNRTVVRNSDKNTLIARNDNGL